MKRKLAALLACAAVLSGCGGAEEPPPTPPPAPRESESAIPAGWTLCSNASEGYAIAYPADWHTAQLVPEQACAFFDPEPFEIIEGTEFPATALEAHSLAVSGRSYEQVVGDLTEATFERTLARGRARVAGHRAVRLATEATGEGLYDRGTRTYAYVIDREGKAFVVKATVFAGDDFENAKAVVDRAVRTLRFFAAAENPPLTGAEEPATGLPAAVETTRVAIAEAAGARDFEGLDAFIPETGFTYTYGGPVEGGPTAYWRQIEAESPERPLEALAAILEMPYTKVGDAYVWPFAYDRDPGTLTAEEREILSAVVNEAQLRQMEEFGHYLGWRAGIDEDGTWIFFVAGD